METLAVVSGLVAALLWPLTVTSLWLRRRRRLREYVESADAVPAPELAPEARDEVDGVQFEELVEEAVELLSPVLREQVANVQIVVEDEPPPGRNLLGLYQGVPLTLRGGSYSGVAPDKISIFRGPLERAYGHDPERLKSEVNRVVLHEVAHHFGISDRRLIELDRY